MTAARPTMKRVAMGTAIATTFIVMMIMTEPMIECQARQSSGNAFRLPIVMGGIFGGFNNNNGDRENPTAESSQSNSSGKMSPKNASAGGPPGLKFSKGPPPPPPPPPRPPRQASSTPFVRGSGGPPDPNHHQQQPHQEKSSSTTTLPGRRPPPPPPPPPPIGKKIPTSVENEQVRLHADDQIHSNENKQTSNKDDSDASVVDRESSASWKTAFGTVDVKTDDVDQPEKQKTNDDTSNEEHSNNNVHVGHQPSPLPNTPIDSQDQQVQYSQQSWTAMNGNPSLEQQVNAADSYYHQYGTSQHQFQQQQQSPPYPYNNGQPHAQDPYATYLQDELNESMNRESALITQLDNLTTTLVVMEQKDELHTRQLDVLTERVMDVEAQAAEDRLLRQEYESNCTMLQTTVSEIQDELDQYQDRCTTLEQQTIDDQGRITELQQAVKEKQAEAEDLAMAMEQIRLIERHRESMAGSSHKSGGDGKGGGGGSGGLLSWVWSLFFGGSSKSVVDDDENTREEAFEMAKSTLLRALQAERGNVHELEAIVATLQQNNSAISEMVESRDLIIDELNNRIAVFEEDKLVLKAALKQLQKEIQEEAPKTQKLIDDLTVAEEEIGRLKTEIQVIIETHQEELSTLQFTISEKQQTISETESNLTAIGTYVDKLEERLTSFAVTRRDIEEREKKCKQIEKAANETETERKSLQVKVAEFEKGEAELKKLLEELTTERTSLQKENRKLYTEREFRISEQEQLEARCRSLEESSKNHTLEMQEWKDKCHDLEANLQSSHENGIKIQTELTALQKNQSSLQSQYEILKQDYDDKQAKLSEAARRNADLNEKLVNATKVLASVKKAAAEKDRVPPKPAPKQGIDPSLPGNTTIPPNATLRDLDTKSVNVTHSGPTPSTSDPRQVPLRSIRKRLSAATNIHGLITPSSKMELARSNKTKVPVIPATVKTAGSQAELPTRANPVDLPKPPVSKHSSNQRPPMMTTNADVKRGSTPIIPPPPSQNSR